MKNTPYADEFKEREYLTSKYNSFTFLPQKLNTNFYYCSNVPDVPSKMVYLFKGYYKKYIGNFVETIKNSRFEDKFRFFNPITREKVDIEHNDLLNVFFYK